MHELQNEEATSEAESSEEGSCEIPVAENEEDDTSAYMMGNDTQKETEFKSINHEKKVTMHSSQILIHCGLMYDLDKTGVSNQLGPKFNYAVRQTGTMGQIVNTCLGNISERPDNPRPAFDNEQMFFRLTSLVSGHINVAFYFLLVSLSWGIKRLKIIMSHLSSNVRSWTLM